VSYSPILTVLMSAACAATSPTAKKIEPIVSEQKNASPIDAFQVLTAGPEDGNLVKRALESDTDDLRMAGLFVAPRIDQEKFPLADPVAALADHPDFKIRALVASVLPTLRTEENSPIILKVLETLIVDEAAAVRIASLNAVEDMEGDGISLIKAIKRAAADPDGSVKAAAVKVSCKVAVSAGRPDLALPIAMAAVGDRQQPVRLAALRGLGSLKHGALPAFEKIEEAADDPSPEIRAAAMRAMPSVDQSRAWPRCLLGIDDPDSHVIAVAGACLQGVHGKTVDDLLARFRHGNRAIERAMAILLAGADPSAAPALGMAARVGDAESRVMLSYSLWHLSRRSGQGKLVSRWVEKGEWDKAQLKLVLDEVAFFTSVPANLETVGSACAERWGGRLVLVHGGDQLACFDHRLGPTEVGVRAVVTTVAPKKVPKRGPRVPGDNLEVEYQALFSLAASNELGLQVVLLQLLEDAGCRYLPERLPETAACAGPGGRVEVRLAPGSGVIVVKTLQGGNE
jgi:HEAT repeat protein